MAKTGDFELDGLTSDIKRPISRRGVITAAAWSVPVIAVGTAAPAFADASNCLGMSNLSSWPGKQVGHLNGQTATWTDSYYNFWRDSQKNAYGKGHHSGSSAGEDAWYAVSNELKGQGGGGLTIGASYTITVRIATQGGYDNGKDRGRCVTANTDMILYARQYDSSNGPADAGGKPTILKKFQTQSGSDQDGITLYGDSVSSDGFETVAFPEHRDGSCSGDYGFGAGKNSTPVPETSSGTPDRFAYTCTFVATSTSMQLGMKFIPFGGDGATDNDGIGNNDDYHVWISIDSCDPSGDSSGCTKGVIRRGSGQGDGGDDGGGSSEPERCVAEWTARNGKGRKYYDKGDVVSYKIDGTWYNFTALKDHKAKHKRAPHGAGDSSTYWDKSDTECTHSSQSHALAATAETEDHTLKQANKTVAEEEVSGTGGSGTGGNAGSQGSTAPGKNQSKSKTPEPTDAGGAGNSGSGKGSGNKNNKKSGKKNSQRNQDPSIKDLNGNEGQGTDGGNAAGSNAASGSNTSAGGSGGTSPSNTGSGNSKPGEKASPREKGVSGKKKPAGKSKDEQPTGQDLGDSGNGITGNGGQGAGNAGSANGSSGGTGTAPDSTNN